MGVATIKDVAAQAGVSVMTVSRVLNGERYVSENKRERVLAAVAALGFSRNPSARGLPGKRTYVLALVSGVIADYAAAIERGAIRRCRKDGYHLAVAATDPAIEDPAEAIRLLISALPADGLILLPPLANDPAVLDLLDAQGKPYVRIAPDDRLERSPSVRIDETAAAEAMTAHLLDLGHRRIGFVRGPPDHGGSARRRQGYLQALSKRGFAADEALMRDGDFSFLGGLAAGRALLAMEDPPTAIFASNDAMALGVMSAAAQAGLSAPRQLAVAGFDDTEVAHQTWPALTTIRQPMEDMGEAAADLLIARIDEGSERRPAEVRMLDYALIVRGSTCPDAPPGGRAVEPRSISS